MSTTITQQTTNVQVRMERDLKNEAERVLEDLGLSLSDGVRVFFKQLVLHKGIPFTLMTKNNVTASDTLLTEKHEKHLNGLSQELEKAKKENSAYTAHSVDDMMDVLRNTVHD